MIYDIQRQSYQIASANQLLIKFEYFIMTQIKENQQDTIWYYNKFNLCQF